MIKINDKDCTGCRICEIVCSVHHNGVVNNQKARLRVVTKWPFEDTPNLCRQCTRPKCVGSCSKGALTVKNGHPEIDEGRCDKCLACVEACPFDAMFLDPQSGLPIPCDTCDGEYNCSQWCPNKVIEVID